jgi:hypothetical protein
MSPSPSTDLVEHVDPVAHSDVKPTLPNADIDQEHQLTFRDAWKHHKAIVGWSFFWAMCAIGWFALLSGTVLFKANSRRGFDAQVNGAMISVPSFRRDFG